jgi:hypothetical protein
MWTAPGRIQVRGKDISGFVTSDMEGYRFHAYDDGKNAHMVK